MIIDDLSISAEQSDSAGLFDLSNEVQLKEFYIDLDGKWNFFEKELLAPDEVKEKITNRMGRVVSLPGSFQTQTGDINSFGTYSATIKIPENYVGETLAIHINRTIK